MYKLLIADDEKIIRESLFAAIDWACLGVEVTAVCADGIELYNAILDEYPDIVITDIMMPGLTGLELIEKIQKIDHSIQFILLSGYREFEYAKKAIRLGVCEYLLKPCREKELISSVRNVCRQLSERDKGPRVPEDYLNLKSSQFWAALRCEIFEALTSDRVMALDHMAHFAGSSIIQIEFSGISFQCAELFLRSQADHMKRLNPRISFLSGDTLVLLASFSCSTDYEGIIREMNSALDSPKPPPVMPSHQVWENTGAAFSRLIARLQSCSPLYSIDSAGTLHEILLGSVPRPEISRLLDLLLTDGCAFEAKLRYIVERKASLREAKHFLLHFFFELLSLPQANGRILSFFSFDTFLNLKEPDEVIRFTLEIASYLLDNEARTEYKPFINQIISYCRDHLDYTDLSLKYVAENILFMNVNYLSREFSKTTGETFSSFLTRARMERAKSLLLQLGEEKISGISKQCGYENPQYFSQVFRKYYGISPSLFLQSSRT